MDEQNNKNQNNVIGPTNIPDPNMPETLEMPEIATNTTNPPVANNVNPSQPMPSEQKMASPVANIQKQEIKRSEKAKQVVNSSKKKSQLVIIAIVIIALIFVGSKMLPTLVKNLPNQNNGANNNDNFKIDTGKKWADAYGTYIKDYYENLEIDRFDISFVDFNEDGTPEMILRYENKNGEFPVRVFQINNNKVNETKYFLNSQFKLIYSSISGEINWYIYIANSNKYGTYTLMNTILKNQAKKADIQATNEKELTDFNRDYLSSEYKINYYECQQAKYLDDFQVIVNRYDNYNKEAKEAKETLSNDTANWIKQKEEGPVKTKIIVGDYSLQFGTYSATVKVRELGYDKTIQKNIVLKDGILIVDGKEVKYTAYANFITVEDGSRMTVTDNNKFTFGTNEDKYALQE